MEILKCVNYLTHKFIKLSDSKQLIASYNGCHPEQEEMMMISLIFWKIDERDGFHFLPQKKRKKEKC